MEYEEENTTDNESLFDRIKESPRTVSALIIILIVAAAIYAFSGDETNLQEELALDTAPPQIDEEVAPNDEMADEEAVIDGNEEDTTAGNANEGGTGGGTTTTAPTPEAPEAVSREVLQEQTGSLPEARQTDSAYVEVAQQGDGVTHLARRATTRYLSEHSDLSLSNEHRIFIEDYIKDRVGSHGLSLGEEVTISFDLVAEATNAAQQLSPQQLQNLSQYTGVF